MRAWHARSAPLSRNPHFQTLEMSHREGHKQTAFPKRPLLCSEQVSPNTWGDSIYRALLEVTERNFRSPWERGEPAMAAQTRVTTAVTTTARRMHNSQTQGTAAALE